MFTTPTVVGELLYAGSCSGVFFAFSASDGEVVWRYDTRDDGEPAQFHGNPIVTEALVVTPSDSTDAGYTYARWVLAGTTAGRLHAFALADGAAEWQTELESRLRGLGGAGDRLYVGTIDGTLYALETIVQDTPTPPAAVQQ